jgi:acyl-CoA synthetase (AMP-forming)/AMP-acid ligase II
MEVYPSDVEAVLLVHSNVREAIVFGVSLNDFEQIVCAFVVLKEESKKDTSIDDLQQLCFKNLEHYQIPEFIKIVDKIKISAVGKYNRSEMSKEYERELLFNNLINKS